MPVNYFPTPWEVIITVLFLSSPFSSRSQYNSAIKVHTFRVIDGLYTVSYERAFRRNLSAEIALQGGHYIDARLNRFEDFEVTGVGALGSLRHYLFTKKHPAPRGFFAYVAMRYFQFNEVYRNAAWGDHYEVGGKIINGGAGIGYKYLYRRFGIEAFVGWGVGRLKSDDEAYRKIIPGFYRACIEEQTHFPQLDVAVGYLFGHSADRGN